jgi:hypothetical protein
MKHLFPTIKGESKMSHPITTERQVAAPGAIRASTSFATWWGTIERYLR